MRKLVKRTLALSGILLALLGVHLGALHLRGNFHEIIPGEYYRSGQMDGAMLHDRITDHGIRSVINLRGSHPGTPWYDDELAVTGDLGVRHYDMALSAADHIDRAEAAQLIALLQSAPKPVLVHCQGGSDRTGLASSLYLSAIADRDEEEAEWQLSLLYGHIALPYLSRAWPMNESWEQLEGWLGYPES